MWVRRDERAAEGEEALRPAVRMQCIVEELTRRLAGRQRGTIIQRSVGVFLLRLRKENVAKKHREGLKVVTVLPIW